MKGGERLAEVFDQHQDTARLVGLRVKNRPVVSGHRDAGNQRTRNGEEFPDLTRCELVETKIASRFFR